MHPLPFLREFVIILGAATAVILVSHKLRIPAVVGFLLTGVLIGPSGLAWVSDLEQVEVFAEIGVVALLFTIGLEFSLERLRQIGRAFFFGGSLQTSFTIAAAAGLALLFGEDLPRAVFIGFVVALSSTAIVLKLYADRRELDSPHGKLVLGILLFQDFLLVPMIILVPVLAGVVRASPQVILLRFGGGVLVVALVFLVARYFMPQVLYLIVRTRIREVLLLGTLFVGLGMALLTEALEFSLALGAFIAGIIVSESEYSHQVVAEVLPFKHVFNSLFFISIGMLLQLDFALSRLGTVIAIATGVLVLKALLAFLAVSLLAFPFRTSALVGLSLAQVGEFSFVLSKVGLGAGLVDRDLYQVFIASAILTMLATPILITMGPRLALKLQDLWPSLGLVRESPSEEETPLRDHVVIVGFGVNGRNLARVLREAGIAYAVVELNGETVRQARAAGERVIYGDATRREILEHCRVETARVIVLAISDLQAVRQAVHMARELNPRLHIIVRTRHVAELEDLYRCGADEVVAEEFETSIEIFTRVLQCYHVPRNVIEAEVRALRGGAYEILRRPELTGRVSEAVLRALEAGTTDILALNEASPAIGRSLGEMDLRQKSGATIIAVVRDGRSYPNPGLDFRFAAGDHVVLVGSHAQIERAFAYLSPDDS